MSQKTLKKPRIETWNLLYSKFQISKEQMKYQKKLFILLPMLTILLFSRPALADTNDLNEKPGILPTSKLYFLKTWGEWAKVNILTFDKDKKTELRLEFAEKRLTELNELKDQGKLDDKQSERLTNSYEKLISKVEDRIERKKEIGGDDSSLADKVSEKMIQHQDVLNKIRDNVPEPAKKAIDKAKEVSMKGEEKAMERLLEHQEVNKDDGKFTAEKTSRMIIELRKHIKQREEKLNKWEQEGKDVSLSRQELEKAKATLNQAQDYLNNKEYRKAYNAIRQGKQYLSGLEHFTDELEKIPVINKVKQEIEEHSLKDKIENKVRNEIKDNTIKEELKLKVETRN